MDKPLDLDRLFWALSTLPLVGAALIDFVGFLVLDTMSKIDQRRKVLEEHIRGWARCYSEVLGKIRHPTEMGVRVIQFDKLVSIVSPKVSASKLCRWGARFDWRTLIGTGDGLGATCCRS
jgi:hypothetical protein